jgi:hypothetical protein
MRNDKAIMRNQPSLRALVSIGFALSIPALCAACGQARVDYSAVPDATPGQGDVPKFGDPGIRFRIPRSIIAVSAQKPATGAPSFNFADEAIDPIDTGSSKVNFGHNPTFQYSVKLTPDIAGVATREDFFDKIATGDMHIVPAPQCVQALLTIYGPKQNGAAFAVTAVPSELEIPADPHQHSSTLSPLYVARPRNDAFSTTTLNVTYAGDTKIMQSIGSTVTDNTQTLIKTVGSVVTAAAGLAALAAPKGGQPPVTVLATIPVTVADNRWLQPVPIPPTGTVTFNTCGANVVTKADATPETIAVGNALTLLMAQAKQIYASPK